MQLYTKGWIQSSSILPIYASKNYKAQSKEREEPAQKENVYVFRTEDAKMVMVPKSLFKNVCVNFLSLYSLCFQERECTNPWLHSIFYQKENYSNRVYLQARSSPGQPSLGLCQRLIKAPVTRAGQNEFSYSFPFISQNGVIECSGCEVLKRACFHGTMGHSGSPRRCAQNVMKL